MAGSSLAAFHDGVLRVLVKVIHIHLALALMVALVSRYNMTEMFSKDNFTMVKNPGKENMEIITKDGQKINRYTPSEDQSKKSGNKGKKVGIAYQLENGEIIYVPEDK